MAKDRKGIENYVSNDSSRLEDEALLELADKAKINDVFQYEHVLVASHDSIPWFTDFDNYLASDLVPPDLSFHRKEEQYA